MTLEEAFAAINHAIEVICEYSPTGVRSDAAAKLAQAKATITTHLTQPAQAVDVGALRNVAAELKSIHPLDAQYDWCHGLSGEITRAIAAPPSNSPTTGAIGENGK